MEVFAQYLDDLEDLFYAFALKWERIRRVLRFGVFVASSLTFQMFAVYLALTSPPIAVAVAALLLVGLLFRAVVSYGPGSAITS